MKVKDIMTPSVTCCTPDNGLPEVARMMVDCDCGEIPVVESQSTMKPVGVITDRDIVVRAVAQGRNPLDLTAREVMTSPVITVTPDDGLDDVLGKMEEHKIRRVPVVDKGGRCCGIVAQADVARNAGKGDTAKVVKEVSEPVGARA
ncbi:MAG TPA: CBS domain-containing protein [Vicinamibacteria bacterium]|jgi:CBS domain-containing protein